MKKILFILSIALLIVLSVTLLIFTSTETGLHWLVAITQKAIPGSLSVNAVKGRLIGPLELNGLEYSDKDIKFTLDTARFNWKPSLLLSLQLHIVDLTASGIAIETEESEQPAQQTDGLPEISLPVEVRIDNLLISNVSIIQKGSDAPFVINTLALKAQMLGTKLRIDSFKGVIPEASVGLKGDIVLKDSYPLKILTDWNIKLEGFSAISGSGSFSGDVNRITIEQSVSAPVNAKLQSTVNDLIKDPSWDMDLTLNNVSFNRINSTWPEITADAKVSSTGSVSTFDILGDMDLIEKQYGQITVSLSAGKEQDTWLARHVTVTVPGSDTKLELSGRYLENEKTTSFEAHLTWNDLTWPLHEKDPVITSGKGTFDIKGSPDNYETALMTDISGQQIPQSAIRLHGTGTKSSLNVQSLTAKLMDGVLNANGSVKWDPTISWNASLNMKSINPGLKWPDWQGALDMSARAEGDMRDSSPRVFLKSANVTGDLRGHLFTADTMFSMDNGTYELKKLDVASGSAVLQASGSYSDVWNARWNVAVPELDDLIPNGKGQIHGKGTIHGTSALPRVTAELTGTGISYESYQVGSLSIDMHVDTTDKEISMIDAGASDILIDSQEIKNLIVKADGKMASHSVSLTVETPGESVILSADAGYDEGAWQGEFNQAGLKVADFGEWKLKNPGKFVVSPQAADIGELCWLQDAASFCLRSLWTETQGLIGNASLTDIPLSLFKPMVPSAVSLEGLLAGSIDMSYGHNKISSTASIALPSGSLSYAVDEENSINLALGLTRLGTTLNQDGLDLDFEMSLSERGKINSSLRLPGFSPLEMNLEKQEVSARVQADLRALDLIPLFTSAVGKPEGVLSSDLSITGALSKPDITGYVNLDKGQAELPDLGLLIKDMGIKLTSDSNGIVHIDGKLSSGEGTAHVQGDLAIKDPANIKADIRVKGEKVEAVNIPQVWVVVSPDVSLKLENRYMYVNGTVIIPEALIEPPDLSNAVSVSPDVVIITEESPNGENNKLKIHSRMQLTLGENVRFKGFGLSSRITGGLNITEEPGKATHAQGELQVLDGQYKAYGQELTIEKGRLLFVGLADDPGLDVRAVRKIKDVSAGVQVIGTLKTPEMRIYSVPVMDQSDALSYLLFGRPMNRISESEGGKLQNAAASAYVSGGGLLAKKIGAKFGIRDVEIEKGETEQESALVIGKYLSPKLYVSYGIGLFEPVNTIRMRYTLSPAWQLQTEHGVESGGDVLYTIER